MKKNSKNTEKLVNKANIDLKTIENLLKIDDSPPESICFHAQQAVEKFFKAYLQYLNIKYNPSHDLDYLAKLIIEKDSLFLKYKDIGETLTPYAVAIRYESDDDIYTLDEAKYAYKLAMEIKKIILEKLDFI